MDKRSAFVLDKQGVIRYAKVYEPGTIPLQRVVGPISVALRRTFSAKRC